MVTNEGVANLLTEIARLLEVEGANPFRVSAYRRAATTVRRWPQPLAEIVASEGTAGLERLPSIGDSLAGKISAIVRRGFSPTLERLRRRHQRLDLFATLPTVGPRLAERIHGLLGIDSLEDLFAAAADGRLRRLPGIGRKRAEAVRESLAARLERSSRPTTPRRAIHEPSVADLLALDLEYRQKAARGELPLTAPRAFNPTHAAWLPVLRATRGGRHFAVHFSNSAASHRLGRTADWVAIHSDDKRAPGVWTVLTAQLGPLRGKRIVRGREFECQRHHAEHVAVQLSLPIDSAGDESGL